MSYAAKRSKDVVVDIELDKVVARPEAGTKESLSGEYFAASTTFMPSNVAFSKEPDLPSMEECHDSFMEGSRCEEEEEEEDFSDQDDDLHRLEDEHTEFSGEITKEPTYCASPVARLSCSYHISGMLLSFRYFFFIMPLTVITLYLHAIKFALKGNQHDAGFENTFLALFVFFSVEIIVLSLVFVDFFLSFAFFADLIATLTLIIDIPMIWTRIIGLPELDLSNGSTGVLQTLRVLESRSSLMSIETVFRYFRYFRIIKVFQTWARLRQNKRRRLREQHRLLDSRNKSSHQNEQESDSRHHSTLGEGMRSKSSLRAHPDSQNQLSQSSIDVDSIDGEKSPNYDQSLLKRGAIGASDVGRLLNERTAIRMALLCVICAVALPFLEPNRATTEFKRTAESIHELVYAFPSSNSAFIPTTQSVEDTLDFFKDYYSASNPIVYFRVPKNSFSSQTFTFDAIDLRSVRRQELYYVNAGPLVTTNDLTESQVPLTLPQVEMVFSLRSAVREEHVFWVILTSVLLCILVIGGRMFAFQPSQLIVRPIEEMMSTILELRKDPIAATTKGKQMSKNIDRNNHENLNEVESLHVALYQFSAMIQKVFGRAGSRIITSALVNGRFDPIIPGKRVYSIFSFSDIRQFTDVTECLRNRVMDFVNCIADIVHGEADKTGGSPNKNVGDAFLLVWELEATQRKAARILQKLGREEDGSLSKERLGENSEEEQFKINVETALVFIRSQLGLSYKGLVMMCESINDPSFNTGRMSPAQPRNSFNVTKNHRRQVSGGAWQKTSHNLNLKSSSEPRLSDCSGDFRELLMSSTTVRMPSRILREDSLGSQLESSIVDAENMSSVKAEGVEEWYQTLLPEEQICFTCITQEIRNLADQALFCTVRSCLSIHTDPKVQKFAYLPEMQSRFENFNVKLGFGLHMGVSVEGPIGSAHKVDASYLSPEVNLSETLESQTKSYGTRLLMSGEFVSLLSPNVKRLCRPVDILLVPGRSEPLEVWTFDMLDTMLDWIILDNGKRRVQFGELLKVRMQYQYKVVHSDNERSFLYNCIREGLIQSFCLKSDSEEDLAKSLANATHSICKALSNISSDMDDEDIPLHLSTRRASMAYTTAKSKTTTEVEEGNTNGKNELQETIVMADGETFRDSNNSADIGVGQGTHLEFEAGEQISSPKVGITEESRQKPVLSDNKVIQKNNEEEEEDFTDETGTEVGCWKSLMQFVSLRPTFVAVENAQKGDRAQNLNKSTKVKPARHNARRLSISPEDMKKEYGHIGQIREVSKDPDAQIGYFIYDRPLTELTKGFSIAFRSRHLQGMRAYVRGQWEVAAVHFKDAQKYLSFEDKATTLVLDYMQSHGNVAPPDWKGRPLE